MGSICRPHRGEYRTTSDGDKISYGDGACPLNVEELYGTLMNLVYGDDGTRSYKSDGSLLLGEENTGGADAVELMQISTESSSI